MSQPTNVKRLLGSPLQACVTSIDLIEKTVRLKSFGQEIWWDASIDVERLPIPGPDGNLTGGYYNMPILRIIIGTRGFLLGKENYIWYKSVCDAVPDRLQIEKAVEEAMTYIAGAKNQQRALSDGGTQNGSGHSRS